MFIIVRMCSICHQCCQAYPCFLYKSKACMMLKSFYSEELQANLIELQATYSLQATHISLRFTLTTMENKKQNTKARDTKGRLEVIKAKMEDLRDMDLPCCFCYTAPWSGGLIVMGDSRMTSIFKTSAKEVIEALNSPDHEDHRDDEETQIHLPPLPAPLLQMNARTLVSGHTNN